MATDNTTAERRTARFEVPDDYDPEHDPTYMELRDELNWHREQLHAAHTTLTAIGALVDGWREHWDRATRDDGGDQS
jgi:hypothetical protein